jgi:hypothetical protein
MEANKNPIIPRIHLDGEEARQFSLKCQFCGGRKVVHFMTGSKMPAMFPDGAYCYPCMLKRCQATRAIPFPIDAKIIDLLKCDMGLTAATPPVRVTGDVGAIYPGEKYQSRRLGK